MPFDFSMAAIFPLQPGTKEPLQGTRGFRDATPGHPIPPDCNIGFVPASLGLVCIDLDPGRNTVWVDENLPPTLTVKTPRGFHYYYRCDEQFGNGRLQPHIDVRSANGYTLLPPSVVDGQPYELIWDVEPIALPEGVKAILRTRKDREHRPLQDDDGDDNESNIAKARMLLKSTDPRDDGYTIACRLRRDIGLSQEKAVELFDEWSQTLDWPWDYEKIWSVCRNAGRYGRGDQGQFGGAGAEAYDFKANTPAPTSEQGDTLLDNTARGWLKREIAPSVPLIGPINSTSRVMLVAPTGIGKTHVGMAIAAAVASGTPWLHWIVPAARSVLYIDGEMPRFLLKERLIEAAKRIEPAFPEQLVLVSTADYPDHPPLNQGSQWVNDLIKEHKPALTVFDNVQALTSGDQKDTETWRSMLKWQRSLTDAGMAQLWIHHANETGGMYGDKTRAYQMDTVIELERSQECGDIAFNLKFTKHRELHPKLNRDAYATGLITLTNDEWRFIEGIKVGRASIESALEGEYGDGIGTAELVRRLIDRGDTRSPVAIKKWIERNRTQADIVRYIVPGITPLRWRIPYGVPEMSLNVSQNVPKQW